MHRTFWALAMLALTAGCSTRTAYLSLQEFQRAQCDHLSDLQELQRCRANARQPYDDYQRQVEGAKPAQ